MIAKLKNLIVAVLSLVVISFGVLGVMMVLGMVTWQQVMNNMSTIFQLTAIIFVVAGTLILLMKLNKK